MSGDDVEVLTPERFACRSCSAHAVSFPPRPRGWRSIAVKPLVGAAEMLRFEVCPSCLGRYELGQIIERCTGLKQGDGHGG